MLLKRMLQQKTHNLIDEVKNNERETKAPKNKFGTIKKIQRYQEPFDWLK